MRASLGAGLTLQAAPCCPHFASRTLQAAPCGPPCKKLAPRAAVRRTNLFLSGHFTTVHSWGGAPNPALLFSLQKSKQKASTPGSHKIYFYPGILQLPTVGQVKCLYNSVKNKFYKRLQRGALNGNSKSKVLNSAITRAELEQISCQWGVGTRYLCRYHNSATQAYQFRKNPHIIRARLG